MTPGVNWEGILQALNTTALAVFAYLLARGHLVPIGVVVEHMLKPLQERIAALERVSAKRDEQNAELQRMQAAAIQAQSQALELVYREQGRDRP